MRSFALSRTGTAGLSVESAGPWERSERTVRALIGAQLVDVLKLFQGLDDVDVLTAAKVIGESGESSRRLVGEEGSNRK